MRAHNGVCAGKLWRIPMAGPWLLSVGRGVSIRRMPWLPGGKESGRVAACRAAPCVRLRCGAMRRGCGCKGRQRVCRAVGLWINLCGRIAALQSALGGLNAMGAVVPVRLFERSALAVSSLKCLWYHYILQTMMRTGGTMLYAHAAVS